ncbi:MAG: TMEM175 family protein [bacterium]
MADEKETTRLEAFSDGVFAIAMTLLVLELAFLSKDEANGLDLWHKLLHIWPKFLSFALSFATILIMWVNHHGLFRYIRRVDAHLLFTNGLLLLLVTFVPFPTAVLGDNLLSTTDGDAKVAAGFYALSYVAINVAWALMWQSIAHRRRVVAPGISDHDARALSMSLLVGFVSYAAAVGLAFVNALASVGLCMLLAIFWTVQAFRHHPEAVE